MILLGLLLAVRPNREHSIGHGHIDVLVGVDAGKLGADDERAVAHELLDPDGVGVVEPQCGIGRDEALEPIHEPRERIRTRCERVPGCGLHHRVHGHSSP